LHIQREAELSRKFYVIETQVGIFFLPARIKNYSLASPEICSPTLFSSREFKAFVSMQMPTKPRTENFLPPNRRAHNFSLNKKNWLKILLHVRFSLPIPHTFRNPLSVSKWKIIVSKTSEATTHSGTSGSCFSRTSHPEPRKNVEIAENV
jgi:hypothetical protein